MKARTLAVMRFVTEHTHEEGNRIRSWSQPTDLWHDEHPAAWSFIGGSGLRKACLCEPRKGWRRVPGADMRNRVLRLDAGGPILIRVAAERIQLELFATKRNGPGVRWLSMRRAACQFGNGPYGLCASWHGFFDNPNGPRGLLYRPPLKLLCRMH